MCRLLLIKSKSPRDISDYLGEFARKCQKSEEYQGHGWGIDYFDGEKWQTHKEINPIWMADFSNYWNVKICIVHARSAYKNEGIIIENNMPFTSYGLSFVFNGELQKVRINIEGRIGAEKIFNLILKFYHKSIKSAVTKTISVLNRRTEYIRANNFIIVDHNDMSILVNSQYSENEKYFQLHKYISDKIFI